MTKKNPEVRPKKDRQEDGSYINKKYKTEAMYEEDKNSKKQTVCNPKTNQYLEESDSWKDHKRDSIKSRVDGKENQHTKTYMAHSKEKNNWMKAAERSTVEKKASGDKTYERSIYSYGYNNRRR